MDDDDFSGTEGGGHILASVSRLRAAKKAAALVVRPSGSAVKATWGFTWTKHPKPGQPRFVIVDEVRFTGLVLAIFIGLCALGFLIADIGLQRVTFKQAITEGGHGVAILIAAIFSFLACVLSAIQIRSHWAHWTHPPSQKHVVRILYMVPIYAISALGSLTFLDLSSYIDFTRGVYEAYVIYTFLILLTKYLGGHSGVVEWMKYKAPQPWPSPMCFLKPVKPDSQYLYYLKYGALQYTILTPICSLAAVVLTSFGAYEDGVIAYDNGYPYVTFIVNVSQLISLYCLVWLYVCMKNELMPFGPLYKFLVVKAVVFATFWQGVGLAVMAHFGWIHNTDQFSVGEVQVGMQDFLVCIEMFIAACCHKYTFGSETYADGSLRLIMEQRALYLAEQSYKRAQESQKEAQKLADALAEAADPSLKGTKKEEEEETPEEAMERKRQMARLISKAMDEDTEGDVLFDEDEVDWTTGQLPTSSGRRSTAGGAYDYIYAYELEHQRPEGVDPATWNANKDSVALTIPMTDIDFGVVEESYAQPIEPSTTSQGGYDEYASHGGIDEATYAAQYATPNGRSSRPSQQQSQQQLQSDEHLDVFDEQAISNATPMEQPKPARGQTSRQATLQQQARSQLQAALHQPTKQSNPPSSASKTPQTNGNGRSTQPTRTQPTSAAKKPATNGRPTPNKPSPPPQPQLDESNPFEF